MIDMVLPCGNPYYQSNVTIYAEGEVLGSVSEKKDGWLFVFLSGAQAVSHGIAGYSPSSPFGGGSQSISFPKECATTDQEIGEFTIALLKAGRKKFMEATPETLILR